MGGSFKPAKRKAVVLLFNPTHRSGWIVQAIPIKREAVVLLLIPTHGSGWIVQALPTKRKAVVLLLNPTHGSGWMVQALPTIQEHAILFFTNSLVGRSDSRVTNRSEHWTPLGPLGRGLSEMRRALQPLSCWWRFNLEL